MATCKECVHYELCKYNTYQQAHYFGKDKEIYITIDNNIACKFFKNKADFVEVKRGRWERCIDWEYDFCCSECGDFAVLGEYNNHDVLTDYCPNCGADMRKGENNAK